VNIPPVHATAVKKPTVIPTTVIPPVSITQTNALSIIPDISEIPISNYNSEPTQLTTEPAITASLSVPDLAAPVVVSSAKEPFTLDVPTSAMPRIFFQRIMMLLKQ